MKPCISPTKRFIVIKLRLSILILALFYSFPETIYAENEIIKEEVFQDWALHCVAQRSSDTHKKSNTSRAETFPDKTTKASSRDDLIEDGCVWLLEQKVFLETIETMPIVHMSIQQFYTTSNRSISRKYWMILNVPLGVQLAFALRFQIDPHEPWQIPFHHCRNNGCLTMTPLDEKLRKLLEDGKKAHVTFQLLSGEHVTIPISLMGITAGLKGLDQQMGN